MNDVVKKMPYDQMTADISISMDDVVSAFVVTYENKLFARKKEITTVIKKLIEISETIDKNALDSVNGSEYVIESIEPFGLMSKIENRSLKWSDKVVSFEIKVLADKKSNRFYSNYVTIHREKSIPTTFVEARKKTDMELSTARAQLAEVLDSIKSVARKERQVRGRIAIRKLEAGGYGNLMEDPELVALVQLDDE